MDVELDWTKWSEDALPPAVGPGEGLELAKKYLDVYGYVVLRDHLSPEFVTQLRNRIADQAAAERQAGTPNLVGPGESISKWMTGESAEKEGSPGGGQFVTGLLAKGDVFQRPLLDEEVEELVTHVIGNEKRVGSYLSSVILPGTKLMGLHTDQWYMNELHKRYEQPREKSGDVSRRKAREQLDADPSSMIMPSYSVNTIWMLTDFTERNGATRIVPKSHLSGIVPEGVVPHRYKSFCVEAPAGSVLVYDARLWHSGGEHRGDEVRYALHATFLAPMIRPATNFFMGLSKDVLERLPNKITDLIGFKAYLGYGTTTDLMAGSISFEPGQNTGFMSMEADAAPQAMPEVHGVG